MILTNHFLKCHIQLHNFMKMAFFLEIIFNKNIENRNERSKQFKNISLLKTSNII